MDVNDLRSLMTLLCFVGFIGVVLWAYSGRQASRFEEASRLPFADDDMQRRTIEAIEPDSNTESHSHSAESHQKDQSHG